MIIPYFAGLEGGAYNHLPRCRAWVDRVFPHYALNYAHAGRIRWGRDERDGQVLTAPVTWWTVPGQRYVYGAFPGETWDHYYVTFGGERAMRMARDGLIVGPERRQFAVISNPERFRAAFEALFALLERETLADPRPAYALEGLFLQIAVQPALSVCTSPLELEVRQWAEQIRAHPEDPWELAAQAQRIAVSPVHLRRVFKRVVGLPPHQFVIRTRLDSAAHLLRATSLPVKGIAAQVGIEDVGYFSRLFTARYGCSPTGYRREAQLLYGD